MDEDEEDQNEEDEDEEAAYVDDAAVLPVVDDDEDDEYEDEDVDDEYDSDDEMPRYCKHWPSRIRTQLKELRFLIQESLVSTFEIQPSVPLFACLTTLSFSPSVMKTRLLHSLEPVATSCSDSFAMALEVYALEGKASDILRLLDSHNYLLRPRDSNSLRTAVRTLSEHGHTQRALQIVEKELVDTARAIRQSLLLSYSQLDLPENRAEIDHVLKAPRGSVNRRDRVEAWVDAITTPGAEQPNPFMFAAMMMGMPAMPGMNHDDDQYTYLDIEPHDPDLDDLRGEYRPALKHRFEGWVDVGLVLKGGPAVLLKVYRGLVDLMPFLKAADAVEEMITR